MAKLEQAVKNVNLISTGIRRKKINVKLLCQKINSIGNVIP